MRLLGFVVWAAMLAACSADELGTLPPEGDLEGYVCHPSLDVLAVGATVRGRDPAGGTVETTTDNAGYFLLRGLAVGSQELEVVGATFTDRLAVNVIAETRTRIADPPCLGGAVGVITGRVCSSTTGTGHWLAQARVSIELSGSSLETFTDADGYFSLTDVPVGTHTVHIDKGSFSTTEVVTVTADATTALEDVCVAPTTQLAVVSGQFDAVEDVLDEVLAGSGFVVDSYDGSTSSYVTDLLDDPLTLSAYDVVLFNCGLADAFIRSAAPSVWDHLRDFVDDGGSIYVSDWAYEVVRVVFPGLLDFYGDDSTAAAARAGALDTSVGAEVIDPGLIASLGTSSVDIVYNKGSWVLVPTGQASAVKVWVRAAAPGAPVDADANGSAEASLTNAPLLVSVPYGQGTVVFTTFHTHQQENAAMQAILRYIIFEL